jgi:hypothetical protein
MKFSPDGSQLMVAGEEYCYDASTWHINLLDVETGACLASMPVDDYLHESDITFGVDGTSISLSGNLGNLKAWRIVPILSNAGTYIDNESSNKSSDYEFSDDDSCTDDLPMVFIPVDVALLRPILPSFKQGFYEPEEEWIVDQQNRRVCWVPPDARTIESSDCHGEKVVLGTENGGITIVDLSGVRY